MLEPALRAQIFISGIVQGVGYRYFVCEIARKLKITGWVTNLDDSRVEVLAEGIQLAIDNLVDELKKGPEHSRVDHVIVNTLGDGQTYHEFRIR